MDKQKTPCEDPLQGVTWNVPSSTWVNEEKRDFILCYYLERMPEDFNKESVLDEAEQIWNEVTERCK